MEQWITDELIENTYLFCVKRIADSEAAEDLSQDILYEAIRAIASGKHFDSFYAWYWRMARNKYADYAAIKSTRPQPLESAIGCVSDETEPIENLIAEEEISKLNYSLSRLASIHREIVICYYLREQTIPQIAKTLGIPEGTVKRRLFDAKRELKGRMETMNTIGKTAYAPAKVDYFFGFSAMQASLLLDVSKIYPQIMVLCRNEAKSVNDIADEMGISPVYLEEALEKMKKVSLLTSPAKGKYQTNCCVFPEEAYARANIAACDVFHDNGFGERITKALLDLKDDIAALPFYGNHFDYRYLMWIFYVEAGDSFGVCGAKRYAEKYGNRFQNEAERTYRVTVEYVLPDEPFDSAIYDRLRTKGWSNLHQQFTAPSYGRVEYVNNFECEPFPNDVDDVIDDWRRGRDKWIDETNVFLLLDFVANPQRSLMSFEEEAVAKMLSRGLLKKDGEGFSVQLPVFSREIYSHIATMIREKVQDLAYEYAGLVGGVVEKELLPFVRRDQMSNFIHWDMRMFFQQLSSLFYHGWDNVLAQPEDYSTSAAGLCIITE